MKNFVKAIDWEGIGFAVFREKSPRISMEKLTAGIFDGPQSREVVNDSTFDEALNEAEHCLAVTEVGSYKLPGKPP